MTRANLSLCFALFAGAGIAFSGHLGTPLAQAPAAADARQNPYDDNQDARRAGQKLFEQHCAACHGKDARGIQRAPALNTPIVKSATPGALFWLLRNGSLRRGMPSFSNLPDQQRWQIVTFLKSLQ